MEIPTYFAMCHPGKIPSLFRGAWYLNLVKCKCKLQGRCKTYVQISKMTLDHPLSLNALQVNSGVVPRVY